MMLEGTLTISLKPPYLCFHNSKGADYKRNCTSEEVREALTKMGNANWPLQECIVRIPGQFQVAELANLLDGSFPNDEICRRGSAD